jgi:hypothetical protein
MFMHTNVSTVRELNPRLLAQKASICTIAPIGRQRTRKRRSKQVFNNSAISVAKYIFFLGILKINELKVHVSRSLLKINVSQMYILHISIAH